MMSRFCRYIDKVFDIGKVIKSLKDKRERPRIPAGAIWTSVFYMFAARLGSLNALEGQLRTPKRLDGLIGSVKPSVDRIGDVFCLMEPEQFRGILCRINHKIGRNKVLRNGWPLRLVAVDGHEFFSQ